MQAQLSQLNLNLSPALSALLARAANLSNASPDEFALAALEKAAQAAIEGVQVIELSLRDHDLFLTALDGNSEPNEALRRAMERHQQLIQP